MKHKVMPPGFEGGKIFQCDYEGCDFFSTCKKGTSGLEGHIKRFHLMDDYHSGKQEKKKRTYRCER